MKANWKIRVFEISFDIPIPENFNGDYEFALTYMTRWIQTHYESWTTHAAGIGSNKNRLSITIFNTHLHLIEPMLKWVFEQPDAFNVSSGFKWI